MDDTDQQRANIPADGDAAEARPGPPKGVAKPAGSGRKKGTPNRATRDLREAARTYTPKALKALAVLLDDPDPKVKLGAVREIFDRGYGRPMTPSEVTGANGTPLIPEVGRIERARKIAFALSLAARDGDANAGQILEQERQKREERDTARPATWHAPVVAKPVTHWEPPPRDPEEEARDEASRYLTRVTDRAIAESRNVTTLRPRR